MKFTYKAILPLLLVIAYNTAPALGNPDVTRFEDGLTLTGKDDLYLLDEVIEITGKLELHDSSRLKLENCNVSILWYPRYDSPHILVSDGSKLELVNTTILVNVDLVPNYSTNGKLIVEDNGALDATGSTITCTSNMWISFKDSSTALLSDVEYNGLAEGSNVHWASEDLLPEGALRDYFDDYRFSCEDRSTVKIERSHIGVVSVQDESKCSLHSSSVSILDARSSVETPIKDSFINVLQIHVQDTILDYTGHLEGYHREWSPRDIFPSTDSNLRLTESSFKNLWLFLMNCDSRFHDASLWYLYVYFGSVDVEDSDLTFMQVGCNSSKIADSTIDYLIGVSLHDPLIVSRCQTKYIGLSGPNDVKAVLSDTTTGECRVNNFYMPEKVQVEFNRATIGDLWLNPTDQFSLGFTDSTVKGDITLLRYLKSTENATITGSLSLRGASLKHYSNTGLNREYLVQVTMNGEPAPNTLVQIQRNGEDWRSYATDKHGVTRFKLRWVDYSKYDYYLDSHPDNLTDTYTVTSLGVRKPISLLSDTPIHIKASTQPPQLLPVTWVILATLFTASLNLLRTLLKPNLHSN